MYGSFLWSAGSAEQSMRMYILLSAETTLYSENKLRRLEHITGDARASPRDDWQRFKLIKVKYESGKVAQVDMVRI